MSIARQIRGARSRASRPRARAAVCAIAAAEEGLVVVVVFAFLFGIDRLCKQGLLPRDGVRHLLELERFLLLVHFNVVMSKLERRRCTEHAFVRGLVGFGHGFVGGTVGRGGGLVTYRPVVGECVEA